MQEIGLLHKPSYVCVIMTGEAWREQINKTAHQKQEAGKHSPYQGAAGLFLFL